jgi:ribosomal protein S11
MQVFDASPVENIISFAADDTMLQFIDVNGDQSNGWEYYGTTRVSGIRALRSKLTPPAFTRSTDILGRSTSSTGPSQVRIDLTATGDGTRRRFGR